MPSTGAGIKIPPLTGDLGTINSKTKPSVICKLLAVRLCRPRQFICRYRPVYYHPHTTLTTHTIHHHTRQAPHRSPSRSSPPCSIKTLISNSSSDMTRLHKLNSTKYRLHPALGGNDARATSTRTKYRAPPVSEASLLISMVSSVLAQNRVMIKAAIRWRARRSPAVMSEMLCHKART